MTNPTTEMRAWSALRLLEQGLPEAAEDELAAAFGYTIQRIKHQGRLLAKIKLSNSLTPDEEAKAYEEMQAILSIHFRHAVTKDQKP